MKNFLFIRRHLLLVSNLIIVLFITAGFMCVLCQNTITYQELAEKHLNYTVSLADLNISKFIENAMSKPVMVSKTMANDEFLKSWILHENEHKNDQIYKNQLYSYLKSYKEKYGYSSVFCVSAKTHNYYYQDGLNKKISKNDKHDIWYYNFINSEDEYDLEVDTNEAGDNHITVFVNFRVEDERGNLLGVIGVGVQIQFLEDLIRNYERNYDLSIHIINNSNIKTSFSGKTNIFVNENELKELTGIHNDIKLNKSGQSIMQWFTENDSLKCLVTKYDNTLDWYLVIEKDTANIHNAFQDRIKKNIIYMLISLAACITITTIVFVNYNELVVEKENIDELTGLWNQKLFSRQYHVFIRKHKHKPITLFMFDIDKFKNVNDSYGHLFGNTVLNRVGNTLMESLDGDGITARWGGDEFIGVFALDSEELKNQLENYMTKLKTKDADQDFQITISVGIAEVNKELSMEAIIHQADTALYYSKNQGGDTIS